MKLSSRVQEIVVSEGRCTPRQCELLAGGRVLVRVQGGPPQPFAIGRDVEDAVVTPAIPAGTSYEWTPPEPGRYFVRSEVYPSLRSEIRVLRPSETAEAVGTASSARTSTAFSRFGSMSAVDEFVPFPALKAAGTGSYSRGTQTGGSSCARQAGAFNPGPMLGRFQADSLGPDEEDSDDEGGGFVAPPAAGLRRRGHAAGAAPQQQQQQQQAVGSRGTLPELGRPAAPAGLDGFSVISGGSGGSPRSGSGSERSTSSAPLYVERRRVPGTLQSTYSAVHSGRSSYSDSRSGGSEERQPLLYSVGGQAGYTASYGPGGLRAYPAAGVPPRMGAEEARTQKCPRCRKEYLSTINQRRCIASHLGASGGAKAARGVADPKQLAEFWDGLSEAERRSVMAVKDEHNGERTLRELSCQILHRKRPGVTDGMAKEQRRLHLAGKMLHDFVTGELPPGGSQLVSVLSQVSEGTFLFERNAINRDEVLSGNNLEAGLGALVTKRLVGAHLAAKQAAAAAMQEQLEREQEDQEAQQAAKKGKQQQQQGQGQAGPAKKQTKGSKAKAKSAAPAAKAGSKPAAAVAAAAAEAPAEPAGSDAEADATTEQASTAGRPPPLQLATNGKASSPQQGGDDELSPPSSSGARYGISPLRASGGASQYTNFLFLAEEAAESAAADDADGWRTAGSGRPSSRASQAAGTKASGSGSSSQANGTSKAGGRSRSPPPGPLPLPPGFAVPPAGWVGPDGAPLMPPPLPPGYYWAAMPAMPGVQFGNVDMAEVLPGGPWPYPPFYPPGAPPPFGLPPPGAMLPPGVPLPPHTLPYGEEGFLAPFPPGMPVPLPPEVTEQLAAAAAAHAAAAPEGAAEEKAAGSAAAATEAAPQPAEPAQPAAAPRKGFLALLQDAYGPAGAAQQPAAASRAQRDSSFDAAAAAAELQRRWQAAAPAAVLAQPPQAAAAEAAPSAPRSASKGRPPSRGSSSGSLGSKSGKASALGSSSGRASPAGGPGKPVVVAVRAWSSDDSTSDGPKWKIQAATQPQQAQQGGAATEQQQQQQQQ
ncbi:hypothetical protein C2E21_3756 [Chlorella sorokiniana]|uniref:Uncharacterized protein n=1 Tax=Chlorella sorokiniana TaxID=3076 RepID=A0A2P6TUT5_CHLSO|nr:hypothetical protein C2E21_3756 [Chlorella sorokiniana]|eukprot:PRW57832.1 hypothetical protein C2E21_3756 [Chlorella sorokiniana]